MLLAKNGYQVEIFEQQDKVGGRNGHIQLGDYKFDIGPTFLMMKDVLEHIFEQCELNLHDFCNISKLDPMYRLVFGDGRELFPSPDKQKMREQLEKFSPGSFAGYLKYLEKEKIKYSKLIPCLQVPYKGLKDFLNKRFFTSLPWLDAHVSLYDVLSRYFDDPDVRIAFTFQAKYIGMSPWSAPGTFSIISYIEHGGGIYHVEGGLNELSKAMAKATVNMGGNIRLGSRVKNIIIENNTAKGVELSDGSKHYADYCVINADFADAMTKLVAPQHRRKYSDEKLAAKGYSCSTYMLYLGVKKRYDLAHHSIIFAHDYKQNIREITEQKTLSEDFSFYVQNACVSDDKLAPQGKSALYVLVPVPNNFGKVDWQQHKQKLRDAVIAAMQQRGGYEDLEANIEEELIITPQDWENKYSVYKGATFNLAHNIGQMLLFRPHNEFECFKNTYLVGGGTHPGSGLPTIYESGRISAELIMRRDGINYSVAGDFKHAIEQPATANA